MVKNCTMLLSNEYLFVLDISNMSGLSNKKR